MVSTTMPSWCLQQHDVQQEQTACRDGFAAEGSMSTLSQHGMAASNVRPSWAPLTLRHTTAPSTHTRTHRRTPHHTCPREQMKGKHAVTTAGDHKCHCRVTQVDDGVYQQHMTACTCPAVQTRMAPVCARRSSSSRVDEKISTYREEFCATPHRKFSQPEVRRAAQLWLGTPCVHLISSSTGIRLACNHLHAWVGAPA